MGVIQNFFKAIFPASWVKDMEVESRKWRVKCPCGFETNIWDLGGIRWHATGTQKNYFKCINCRKWKWHTVYKQT